MWTPIARAAQSALKRGWRGYLPQPTTQLVESVAGLSDRQIVARLFALAGRGGEMLPALEVPEASKDEASNAPTVYTPRVVYTVWQGSIWRIPVEAT